jgi:hypothetical protein
VVDGNKWNNGTSEMCVTCGSEPDGTFHGECGPRLGRIFQKGVTGA